MLEILSAKQQLDTFNTSTSFIRRCDFTKCHCLICHPFPQRSYVSRHIQRLFPLSFPFHLTQKSPVILFSKLLNFHQNRFWFLLTYLISTQLIPHLAINNPTHTHTQNYYIYHSHSYSPRKHSHSIYWKLQKHEEILLYCSSSCSTSPQFFTHPHHNGFK